jgi:hypothetical protein
MHPFSQNEFNKVLTPIVGLVDRTNLELERPRGITLGCAGIAALLLLNHVHQVLEELQRVLLSHRGKLGVPFAHEALEHAWPDAHLRYGRTHVSSAAVTQGRDRTRARTYRVNVPTGLLVLFHSVSGRLRVDAREKSIGKLGPVERTRERYHNRPQHTTPGPDVHLRVEVLSGIGRGSAKDFLLVVVVPEPNDWREQGARAARRDEGMHLFWNSGSAKRTCITEDM